MTEDRPWPFDDPPDLGVFVTLDVIGGATPTQIVHDAEGDWAFSAGMDWDQADNLELVHLSWVAHTYEEAWNAAWLPRGRGITRQPRTGTWVEYDSEED